VHSLFLCVYILQAGRDEELEALRRESDMPLDELLKTLPAEMFEKADSGKEPSSLVQANENAVSCVHCWLNNIEHNRLLKLRIVALRCAVHAHLGQTIG
jgi:hypothetical protein